MRLWIALLGLIGFVGGKKTDECVGDNAPFTLASSSSLTYILTNSQSPLAVHIAANLFAEDIRSAVPGSQVSIYNITSTGEIEQLENVNNVIVGTLSDDIMREVHAMANTNVTNIENQWEAWSVEPTSLGSKDVLIVSGADRRGTIFGLYTLSEQMGVSPWHWFADVPTRTQDIVQVQRCFHLSPIVKYRGIFLNNEQPGLTNWANKHFGTGNTMQSNAPLQQSFLPDFYEKVFELLLRLKANMLWPAMWSDMFAVAGLENLPNNWSSGENAAGPNQVMADAYGIIYSTSHQEPMARNTPEWWRFGNGVWNYTTNKEFLQNFWRFGAERAAPYETLFTVGMRGDGDLPLPGANVPLLESIVRDQQQILNEAHGNKSTSQVWCLYKEVQGYYDEDGLKVPDDVTLLWTDDNWGNIRRVASKDELSRYAGSGLYYHFDYVGGPRNYKWTSTVNFVKTWEQIHVAVQNGLDRIFIVNVGDLKPIEVATHFVMDLAYYGTTPYINSDHVDVQSWLTEWSSKTFPNLPSKLVGHIIGSYNALNNKIKPELLSSTTWSLTWNQEAEMVLSDWKNLTDTVEELRSRVTEDQEAAFEQLVSFPTLSSANLNELYVAVGKANLFASQARTSSNFWAQKAHYFFKRDAYLTETYHSLLDRKWDGIMSQPHINYQFWQQPMRQTLPPMTVIQEDDSWPLGDSQSTGALTSGIRISIEGSNGAWPGDNRYNCADGYNCPPPTLPIVDRYGSQSRWIDLSSGSWYPSDFSLTTNASWLIVSQTSGQVNQTYDIRLWVKVDWDKLTSDDEIQYGAIFVTSSNHTFTKSVVIPVTLPINTRQVQGGHNGAFIQGDGIIAMPAWRATETVNASDQQADWLSLPGYGLSGNAMTTQPANHETYEVGKGPSLSFDFFMHNSSSGMVRVTTYIGPTLNYRPENPMTFALQMDNLDPVTVRPIPLASSAGADPPDWGSVVAAGIRRTMTTIEMGNNAGEWHNLKLWITQPGLVIEMVVIGTNIPPVTLPPRASHQMS